MEVFYLICKGQRNNVDCVSCLALGLAALTAVPRLKAVVSINDFLMTSDH